MLRQEIFRSFNTCILSMRNFFLCLSLFTLFPARAELNLELPDINLPELQNGVFAYSDQGEKGTDILRLLRRSGDIIEDPELSTWIHEMGNRLFLRAPRSPVPVRVLISKSSEINAFATIGGVIVINAGLILKTDNESELAAVIAHEIAHVTQQHIQRMIDRSSEDTFKQGAAMIAGVVAGSQNPQLGQAIFTTALATSLHKQLSYSRENEAEADKVGLSILSRSSFDPLGMPQFLKKLEQLSDDRNSEITKYLQSHPLAHERVLNAQLEAARTPRHKQRPDETYQYMREKLRLMSGSRLPPPDNLKTPIKHYSKARAAFLNGQYATALNQITRTPKYLPDALLLAEIYNRLGQFKSTIKLLTALQEKHPTDEALAMQLAQAYQGIGQSRQAWQTIKRIPLSELTSLEFLEQRQQIAHKAGMIAEAYRSVAERNLRMGEYRHAALQLRQAMKFPDATPAQLLEYQTLLSEAEEKQKR